MVHRIQNRNPGYSEPLNNVSGQSFNFSESISSSTEGATALKIDNEFLQNEINSEISSADNNLIRDLDTNITENDITTNDNEVESENPVEENKNTNGLENFKIEEETLELFNSEDSTDKEEQVSIDTNENNTEDEDEFEIPAFLRRQKN